MPRLLAIALLLAFALPARADEPVQKKSAKGMTYSLRLPAGYVKGQHTLLVGLHGAGDNCGNFVRWLISKETSLPKNSILLVPQALQNGSWDKADLGPLTELVRDSQAEFQPARTIGIGFSRGAFYLFHLAFNAPEMFQGALPCAGGLPDPVPDSEVLKAIPFYITHGALDTEQTGVDCALGEKAFADMQAKKCLVKFEKVPGMKHTVDWEAVKRGVDWITGILDERDKAADDAIGVKVTALEATLKEKSWEAAVKGFAELTRIPRSLAARVAGIAKPHVVSPEEALALAAIDALGRCGAEGVPGLKGIPISNLKLATAAATALGATASQAAVEPLLAYVKSSKESVSVAAAGSLAKIRCDAAAKALVSGLVTTEGGAAQDGRKPAILAALKALTGQAFAKSSEWKKWLADNPLDAGK